MTVVLIISIVVNLLLLLLRLRWKLHYNKRVLPDIIRAAEIIEDLTAEVVRLKKKCGELP